MTTPDPIQQNKHPIWLQGVFQFTRMSSSQLVAVGYLCLLGLAEYLVAINAPQLGLPLHGLILTALLWHSSLVNQPDQREFLLALSLAPLIRLISLLMPLKLFPMIYWYLITAVPLFFTSFLIARIAGISRIKAGLVLSPFPVQLLVSLSGFILGYVEYVILRPAPLVPALRWELIWFPGLILLVFTGFLEELIFRGLMQSSALPHLGRYAIPYVAAVFAMLHLGYRSVLDFLFVFGVALFFGYIVKRSGSILGVSVAHGLINIMLFLIFPLILVRPVTSQRSLPSITPGPTHMQVSTPSATPKPTAPNTPVPTINMPTRQVDATATVVPTVSQAHLAASPTPQPTKGYQAGVKVCPKALPTRLKVGEKAKVLLNLNLRQGPGMDKFILSSTLAGKYLDIVGGPVCIPYGGGAFWWWEVKSPKGMTGWSAEGSLGGTIYFLSPSP
jgi:hypothetical protein